MAASRTRAAGRTSTPYWRAYAFALERTGSSGSHAAFLQGMQDTGWEVGRNLRIEYRWSVGDTARLIRDARELVALNPDAILAGVGATTAALSFRLYSHKVSIRSVTNMSIV